MNIDDQTCPPRASTLPDHTTSSIETSPIHPFSYTFQNKLYIIHCLPSTVSHLAAKSMYLKWIRKTEKRSTGVSIAKHNHRSYLRKIHHDEQTFTPRPAMLPDHIEGSIMKSPLKTHQLPVFRQRRKQLVLSHRFRSRPMYKYQTQTLFGYSRVFDLNVKIQTYPAKILPRVFRTNIRRYSVCNPAFHPSHQQ